MDNYKLVKPLTVSRASNFIEKETLAQVFSCEFCEISKNTFFTEHFWATASIINKISPFADLRHGLKHIFYISCFLDNLLLLTQHYLYLSSPFGRRSGYTHFCCSLVHLYSSYVFFSIKVSFQKSIVLFVSMKSLQN